MLKNRNVYPFYKPFKEFSKKDAEELFDHILSGDTEDEFSIVERLVDNMKNNSGIAFKNDAALYQDKYASVLYEQSYGSTEFVIPHQLDNFVISHQLDDFVISHQLDDFVISHQLDDFVKLAQNGVDDLNHHFTQNNSLNVDPAEHHHVLVNEIDLFTAATIFTRKRKKVKVKVTISS
ncbi:2084_t:CDS:2 [Dentiscutata erythropus]|uniref:2084_t:CDS:1 n=1 Tax=Dentiscutata erythropus TaxID=1348616 RepID=A0A9N8ZK51_9GLOM|nr:2084_t:CDS:2 [Dentiscutata erythropus]